ncbi:MAG TPA: DUF4382 domain-containing protein [Candidatus Acidoferrum sp.]|nr:DUF4382 domain-containing protein [Candidatus Acidoferrum sp.]
MLRNNVLISLLLVATISLASCSGQSKSGGVGGGGNTTLSLTMRDTLLAGTSIVSFKVTVTGVSFTPSAGKPVNLTLNPSSPIIELTHLQSDSAFLGTSTVPSANYTSATVAFSAPDIVLINQTTGALTGATTACPVSAVTPCEFRPAASGTITLSTAPFPLTLTPNQQTGLSLDFNLNNAITTTNGAVSVDFTQANVLTATTLPRTGTPTGALDLVEDFTGVITAVSGTSVTVHSDTRGNITAIANSSTTFNIDPNVCNAQNLTCLGANKTVSIDASLNLDGTMTLLEADLLDKVSVDEVEGTVFSVNQGAQQILLVLSNKTVVSGNPVLTAAAPGNLVQVTITNALPFTVDTKGLSAITASLASIPFATLSNVFPGQTVRMHVTNPTAGTGSTILVNSSSVVLRFSQVTAKVSIAPASPFFSVNAATLPPFIAGLGGFVNAPVQISSGQTRFDGVTDITGLNVGDTVSIRALFIPNFLTSPFFAAKVRKH